MHFPAKLVLFLALCHTASTQSLFNSPNGYFGGENHAEYIDWIAEKASSYNASFFLPSLADQTDGAAVHWKIENSSIFLTVAVRATGWLGFGLAEAGGMEGSDLFFFETFQPDNVTDAYVLDERYPVEDDCQDWKLIDWQQDSEFLIVQASRLLNTGDPQDRPILDDSSNDIPVHRIIAAWGDSDGIRYHGDRRARGAVRWYRFGSDDAEDFQIAMSNDAEGYFELKANDYPIKPIDTEYVDFCLTWTEIQEQLPADIDSFMVIGIEHLINDDTARHIHHFTTFGTGDEEPECGEKSGSMELVYAWAPGEPAMLTPPEVGIPFGGDDGHKSLRLEIHYDNPQLLTGGLDSSGIRLYYTTKLRRFELGGLQLGDPILSLRGELVGDGNGTITEHTFNCPNTCSLVALDEPVTVHVESLHMHKSGIFMRNELIRNDQVIHVGQVDYFNFDQQGSFLVQQEPFQVLPGDAWRTTCTFQPSNNDTRFGFSSQEEMCIAFLFYYPRKTLARDRAPWICSRELPLLRMCEATHVVHSLESEDDVSRKFGSKNPGECRDPAGSGSAPTRTPSSPPFDDGCWERCNESVLGTTYWMHKELAPGRLGRNTKDDDGCTEQCAWPFLVDTLKQYRGYKCGRCQQDA